MAQLKYQTALGRQLLSCRPELKTVAIPQEAGREELFALCAQELSVLDVPVHMVGFGPTELDKLCK